MCGHRIGRSVLEVLAEAFHALQGLVMCAFKDTNEEVARRDAVNHLIDEDSSEARHARETLVAGNLRVAPGAQEIGNFALRERRFFAIGAKVIVQMSRCHGRMVHQRNVRLLFHPSGRT